EQDIGHFVDSLGIYLNGNEQGGVVANLSHEEFLIYLNKDLEDMAFDIEGVNNITIIPQDILLEENRLYILISYDQNLSVQEKDSILKEIKIILNERWYVQDTIYRGVSSIVTRNE
ncbi:MAG TPA: hypothetical protein VJJ79_01940, partial [Candidatus Nanoarchaeia archaeon]|nr:hypothetical protein [Candidatus Nanoarchaeia archaeon]